jgi:hypothetical protein
MSIYKESISNKHQKLATAFDISHDFLKGNRVGKVKSGEAGESTYDTSIKKGIVATLVYDLLKEDQNILTNFPISSYESDLIIEKNKKFN